MFRRVALAWLLLVLPRPVSGEGPELSRLVLERWPDRAATLTLDGPRQRALSRPEASGTSAPVIASGLQPGVYRLTWLGDDSVPLAPTTTIRLLPGETRRLDAAAVFRDALVVSSGGAGAFAEVAAGPFALGSAGLEPAQRSRNVQATLDLLPTLVQSAASRSGGDRAPAVRGGQNHELVTLVDGVDTSFARSGGRLRLFLPATVVDSVQIEAPHRSVAYGRGSAGVVDLRIRRGGVDLAGGVRAILQSPRLRSDYDDPQLTGVFRDGAGADALDVRPEIDLGGPLLRQRIWFFGALAETSTLQRDRLVDGSVEDTSFVVRTALLKLDARLADRASLSLLGIEAPLERTQLRTGSADRWTPCACDEEQRLMRLHGSFAPSPRWTLEARLAGRRERTDRRPLRLREPLVGASPDSPLGNDSLYFDRDSGLRWNGLAVNNGAGWQEAPRDQAHLNAVGDVSRHELRFGVDLQETSFRLLNERGREYQGRGFDAVAPGGFRSPQFVRVYEAAVLPSETSARFASLWAQDAWLGERWTVRVGARLDRQEIDNDLGERALSSDDPSLRFEVARSLVVAGRSAVLRAHAGRTVQAVPLELASREFARLPNGGNVFEEFGWNRATGRYDRFRRRGDVPRGAALAEVQPYARDEAGLELDVDLRRWRLGGSAILWEAEDLYWSTDQFDVAGGVVRDVRNWPESFRRGRQATLVVRRTFGVAWSLRGDLTWSRTTGNQFALDDDSLFEGLGGLVDGSIDDADDLSERFGRGPLDREWSANVVGSRSWRWGRQRFDLVAWWAYRSGERWGRVANVDVAHPTSGGVIRSQRYLEPRDARRLAAQRWLDLAATWTRPWQNAGRALSTEVALQVSNLTDRQDVVGVNRLTGDALPGVRGVQLPREVRLVLGVRF